MMGKMDMTPKEFLEKLHGVKLEEPAQKEMETVRQIMEQTPREMAERKARRHGQEDV